MALPPELGDREVQKFVETDAGKVAVRVQGSDINGLDTGNSTTVELGTNQEFIGQWLDVSSYKAVFVSLATQHRGTLYIEWSSVNTDNTSTGAEFSDSHNAIGGQEYLYRHNHKAQYYRTRYLNNGFAQTRMILNTFQGEFNAPDDAVRIRDREGNQADMLRRDGKYLLMTADPVADNMLRHICDELKKLNQNIESIME
jgi:hypothetical protein